MAGLEVLYALVGGSIGCPQDAAVCFVHWEMIRRGYRCMGSGDQPLSSEKKSELLPADWNSNKELYTLRYQDKDSGIQLILKAIAADNTLIFNLMNANTQQLSDLTVNISDHVDADQLNTYDRVFKDVAGLSEEVRAQLLPSQEMPSQERGRKAERESRGQREERQRDEDSDPLRNPYRRPRQGIQPNWPGPLAPPIGGGDLDPFGSHGGGGMRVDPLRSGYPRSGFDPSSGIPGVLPRGAVPPGAHYEPIHGPVAPYGPGPDPDHLPPPGYDDMFM